MPLTLPYTLTNGTKAEADKVLANFYAILDYFNLNTISSTLLPNKYVRQSWSWVGNFEGQAAGCDNRAFPALWTIRPTKAWDLTTWETWSELATGSVVLEAWVDAGAGYVLVDSMTIVAPGGMAFKVIGGAGISLAAGSALQFRQSSAVYTQLRTFSTCLLARSLLE
jgi:hypothetical protein